ncbi:hypothetical protein BHM03_00013831 [Ensete ventricosum]|nr:hypothetical protein BHM03_00013831 [Ensete ventricosum]
MQAALLRAIGDDCLYTRATLAMGSLPYRRPWLRAAILADDLVASTSGPSHRCHFDLTLPVYTWAHGYYSLVSKGCAGSSRYRLVGRESRLSPCTKVSLWALVELQSSKVCCDVLGGVAFPRLGDLVRLASVGGASFYMSAFFHSSAGSSVVDACTKAVVGGGVSH